MKQREKTMALVLIALMTLVVGGVVYFQYYSRTMTTLEKTQHSVEDEDFKAEMSLMEINKGLPRLEQAKKLSLPPDVESFSSKREYTAKLEDLLRKSDFYAGKSPFIDPKPPENISSLAAAKRPPYTKLTYNVRASGELSSLVDFLDRFYRTPLLHRIKSLTLTRPLTNTRGQRDGDLDIVMVIEALILDGAEKRTTLLPELSGKDLPKVSAREPKQYDMIAGNNIFFGPYTPPPPPTPESHQRNAAFLAEIRLNEITHKEDGIFATFYDEFNQYFYVIRKRVDGTFRSDTYYMLKGRRAPLHVGEKVMEVEDEHGAIYHTFQIVRIDLVDVFLEENDKLYRVHIGDMLASKQKLSDEEARKYGLPVKEKKDKPAEKKDRSKTNAAAKAEPLKGDGTVTPVKKEDKPEPEKKEAVKADGK
jgi:hypothetical protein